jgi:Xaa-Pro aminopeptidase
MKPVDVKEGRSWVYDRMLYFPKGEYAARREKLWQRWNKSKPILLLGRQAEPGGVFQQRTTFEYFTGFREPGAALLLVPQGKRSYQSILFMSPLSAEIEKWEGRRFDPKSKRAETTMGVDKVVVSDSFEHVVDRYVGRSREVGVYIAVDRFGKEHWEYEESQELKAFLKKFQLKGISASYEVGEIRKIKSAAEIRWHTEADRITGESIKYVLKNWTHYKNEYQIQGDIEGNFRKGGALELAYYPIVAAGFNATVLHYRNNDYPLNRSQMVLMDVGCRFRGYCADITRVFPRAGKYSKEQRKLYELVLQSQLKTIALIRPGVTWEELNDSAWGFLKAAGFERWHGFGHFLGMDVHDVGDYKKPLEPGCVITAEPGIYLPDVGIGIRIEDDVLVTKTGCKVLSSMIPKKVSDVEALLR